jgi:hypothetical protein
VFNESPPDPASGANNAFARFDGIPPMLSSKFAANCLSLIELASIRIWPGARLHTLSRCTACPTGKSLLDRACDVVQPLLKKYSAFPKSQITLYSPPSRPTRGAFAIVTNAGRVAVDAGCASDESTDLRMAKSCGPDASALASSFAEATPQNDGVNKPITGEITYKL